MHLQCLPIMGTRNVDDPFVYTDAYFHCVAMHTFGLCGAIFFLLSVLAPLKKVAARAHAVVDL